MQTKAIDVLIAKGQEKYPSLTHSHVNILQSAHDRLPYQKYHYIDNKE